MREGGVCPDLASELRNILFSLSFPEGLADGLVTLLSMASLLHIPVTHHPSAVVLRKEEPGVGVILLLELRDRLGALHKDAMSGHALLPQERQIELDVIDLRIGPFVIGARCITHTDYNRIFEFILEAVLLRPFHEHLTDQTILEHRWLLLTRVAYSHSLHLFVGGDGAAESDAGR